jgi:hypothetical protein
MNNKNQAKHIEIKKEKNFIGNSHQLFLLLLFSSFGFHVAFSFTSIRFPFINAHHPSPFPPTPLLGIFNKFIFHQCLTIGSGSLPVLCGYIDLHILNRSWYISWQLEKLQTLNNVP